MNFKKRIFILTSIILIIIQIILYQNNNQKTSFRYFTWNIQEITIGKLITLSFISGFLISTILSATKADSVENFSNNYEIDKESQEIKNNKKDTYSEEIPPQRDIRETQPTISVNYRIIKDSRENNPNQEDYSKEQAYGDDWDNFDNDW